VFHSAAFDEAVEQLMTAIGRHEGVVLLTGDLGTGKTTLCRAIVERLDQRTFASFITTPCLSVDDLIANVLVDCGVIQDEGGTDSVGPRGGEAIDLASTLRVFMQSLDRLHANAVVVIDDAHRLPIGVLEKIAWVSELGERGSRLQIVLVGRPELATLLERSELKPLEQHLTDRCVLGPMAANEIAGYLTHRLSTGAAARQSVRFDERALFLIYELTGGVPHAVNEICDRALSRVGIKGGSTIDGALIESCAEDLGLQDQQARPALGTVFVLGLAAVWILLVGVGAAGAVWVFQGAVTRTIVGWESVPRLPASPPSQMPSPIAPVEPPTQH
jgi:general secretion pathway protein A